MSSVNSSSGVGCSSGPSSDRREEVPAVQHGDPGADVADARSRSRRRRPVASDGALPPGAWSQTSSAKPTFCGGSSRREVTRSGRCAGEERLLGDAGGAVGGADGRDGRRRRGRACRPRTRGRRSSPSRPSRDPISGKSRRTRDGSPATLEAWIFGFRLSRAGSSSAALWRSLSCSSLRCGTSAAAPRRRATPCTRRCRARAAQPAAAKLLVVDVAGDVRHPGLYRCRRARASTTRSRRPAAQRARHSSTRSTSRRRSPTGSRSSSREAARAASRRLPPLPARRRPHRSTSTRRPSSSSRRCPGSGR